MEDRYEMDKYATIDSLVARLLLARTLYRHMRTASLWLRVFAGLVILWTIYSMGTDSASNINSFFRFIVSVPILVAGLSLRRGLRFLEAIYDEDYLVGHLEAAKNLIRIHWKVLESTWLENGFGK